MAEQTTFRLRGDMIQQLRRFTTPTVYNGWELITKRNAARECFNLEPVRDFSMDSGAMVGFAVTVEVKVGGPKRTDHRESWAAFRRDVSNLPGPKILVVQDLDKPQTFGSIIGEVSATLFKSLGFVGAIIDGGVRDIAEMRGIGFRVLGRQPCIGHGVGTLVKSGGDVDVFGCRVSQGQLLHADQHGFLAVPAEDEEKLLRAAAFLDAAEAALLHAAHNPAGWLAPSFLDDFDQSLEEFIGKIKGFSEQRGEW